MKRENNEIIAWTQCMVEIIEQDCVSPLILMLSKIHNYLIILP